MLLVRQTFQARYGRGDELVALFKELREQMGSRRALRIMTDASGPFFTVVTEFEVESFADWEQTFSQIMGEILGRPEMQDWFSRMMELVESGRRDFYNIVE